MQELNGLLGEIKQHEKLTIRVGSHDSPPLSERVLKKLSKPHRSAYYFFVFVKKGNTAHQVDLGKQTVSAGQLLFILPNQIHTPPPINGDLEYFKMSFDQNCLSLLPKQFPFLINPLNKQVISFDTITERRITQLFKTLDQLLQENRQSKAELILAHLNTLMTELDISYFNKNESRPINGKFKKYIEFKLILETHLTEQYSVSTIAGKLAVSTNSLYIIVKEFSGVSPKEYVINRLMLEAQRKLHYSDISTKALAYELGFNDPDYFSRLFKKHTGKNVGDYITALQDL